MRRSWMVLAVVSLLAACDDPEDVAQRRCERLATVFCDRVADCAVGTLLDDDGAAALRSDCEDGLIEGLGCEDAVEIADDFQDCLDDAQLLECSESNAQLASRGTVLLPASCEAVIGVRD